MKNNIKPKFYHWKVNWGYCTIEVQSHCPEVALKEALKGAGCNDKKYVLVSKNEDPDICALLRCPVVYVFKEDYRWAYIEYSVWLDGRKHGML